VLRILNELQRILKERVTGENIYLLCMMQQDKYGKSSIDMVKLIMVLLLTVICGGGCAQEKKERAMSTTNRISYHSEKVRRFKDEPLYQLEVESLFSFSVLINGCPVYSNFDKIPGTARININPYILQSGQQQVTIELYPGYDDQGISKPFLEAGDKFTLKIEKTGWGKDGLLKEPEEIVYYKAVDEKEDLTKRTAYKTDISFTAIVPYQLAGWKNGQDLTRLDPQQLEEQVLGFYKEMIAVFETGDYDDLNARFLKADAEWYQSEYFSQDIISKFQTVKGRKGKSVATTFSNPKPNSLTFYALEDYIMKFYAEGRMVRLEPRKGVNRGESLLGYMDTDKNGMNRKTFVDMLLYIPKGETALQIVR